MVERDAGEGEEQQADQADRGTDPMPGMKLLQPESLGVLLPGGMDTGGSVHRESNWSCEN
jgi:hypothetical protein